MPRRSRGTAACDGWWSASTPCSLIAITGDMVCGSVADLGEAVAPLAELRAKYGIFCVSGRAEATWDAQAWMARMRSLGARPLQNEFCTVEMGADTLQVAGVNNGDSETDVLLALSSRHAEPAIMHALSGSHAEAVTILLTHNPKVSRFAASRGVDLMLSGYLSPYSKHRLIRADDTLTFATPELCLLTLHRAPLAPGTR